MERKKVYTPNQILGGSLWGGPLASIYFLRYNYLTLGKEEAAQKTLLYGGIFIILLLGLIPLVPQNFPRLIVPLSYCLAAWQLAYSTQLKKEEIAADEACDFASNWKTFGISTLAMACFFIIVIIVMSLFITLGIIEMPASEGL
jgi:heme O synthase-like polyprenyltransferase